MLEQILLLETAVKAAAAATPPPPASIGSAWDPNNPKTVSAAQQAWNLQFTEQVRIYYAWLLAVLGDPADWPAPPIPAKPASAGSLTGVLGSVATAVETALPSLLTGSNPAGTLLSLGTTLLQQLAKQPAAAPAPASVPPLTPGPKAGVSASVQTPAVSVGVKAGP
jgi:hypothetical protein